MGCANLRGFCLQYEKIYIYGAGVMAHAAASKLESLNCKYEAFVVSDGSAKEHRLYSHQIIYLSELQEPKQNIAFILGLNKKNADEVVDLLKKKGYLNYFSLAEMDEGDWTQRSGLTERCDLVKKYAENGIRVGVLLCDLDQEYQHTYRYRAYNMQQITGKCSARWKYVCFFIDELEVLGGIFSLVHTITLLRLKWSAALENFISKAKEQKIAILYDIDDLVFDIDYIPLFIEATGQPQTETVYSKTFSHIARKSLLATKAEGFIATNPYIAQKLINKFGRACVVIPNFLNFEQLEIAQSFHPKTIKKNFTIGYFSGSNTHVKDFSICFKEIMLLMEEFPDIKLRVVGYMDFPLEMEAFFAAERIESIPFVDFESLQRLIAEVDVNIIPLAISEFTHCKSELKFFEAAIMRTITCASPTYVFQRCIQDGYNGFLCNEGDWYRKIKQIYQQKFDLDQISDNAYRYALQNYTGETIIKMIENAYDVSYTLSQCKG